MNDLDRELVISEEIAKRLVHLAEGLELEGYDHTRIALTMCGLGSAMLHSKFGALAALGSLAGFADTIARKRAQSLS